jgi:hypothetical protein
MDDYRVYRLNDGVSIAAAELIRAADDEDAVSQARKLGSNGLKCEVWQGRRLVLSLDKGELAA